MRENGNTTTEIIVGPDECRVAQRGDLLRARHLSSDWAIAIHHPAAGIGVVTRFGASFDVDTEIRAALAAMPLPRSANHLYAYAIGGASIAEDERAMRSFKSRRLAIQATLWRERVLLKGEDLGGNRFRSFHFDPAAGRLIVGTGAILAFPAAAAAGKAAACHLAS
jgi:chemotaxis receptor (MCP) glutamine deamidase CheD